MEKISVITPLYKGSIFVDQIIQKAKELQDHLAGRYKLELILVNDKPDDIIEKLPLVNFELHYIKNIVNQGIQQSRINGLKASTGDFIVFLDQDDELVFDGFEKGLLKMTLGTDCVVGNLFIDRNGEKKKIYNKELLDYLIRENIFIDDVNPIISPGQCIIRREAIPQVWCDSALKVNGADDWMLWLLMFNAGASFVTNEYVSYYHKTTELGNLSSDNNNMYNSELELLNVLKKNGYPINKLKRIKMTFEYLHNRKGIHSVRYYFHLCKRFIYKIRIQMLA